MKDFYGKIFKSSKKDIKEDNRRWKDIPSSQIDRNNIGKISILPKSIYRFKTISINISTPQKKILYGPWKDNYQLHTEKEQTKKTTTKNPKNLNKWSKMVKIFLNNNKLLEVSPSLILGCTAVWNNMVLALKTDMLINGTELKTQT